jgi:hypothetical protein
MGRRASRLICLLTAVLLLGLALAQDGSLSWGSLLGPLLLWPYLTAIVFISVAVACALLRRPAPSLPVGERRVRGGVLLLLIAFVVVATITRENGNWSATIYWSEASWHTDSHSSKTSNTRNGAKEPSMAEASLSCAVACEASRACDRLLQVIDCPRRDDIGFKEVLVEITAQIDGPSCFLPLYKTGNFSAKAKVKISHRFPDGSATSTMDIEIHGDATMSGFAPCRSYHEYIGRIVAESIVNKINDDLAGS